MPREQTVTFGAVGDIDLSRTCADAMIARGRNWPFQKMLPVLRRADVLFGNMESVVLPAGYPDSQIDPAGLVGKYDGTPALRRAGFDFLNLAANHILDGGHAGMFHTHRTIQRLGIAAAGVGRTQRQARRMRVVEKKGLRFGFLCYCEDTNYSLGTVGPCHAYFKLDDVLEDVRAKRREVDLLVVSVHADLEFMETPSPPRREAFRRIARAGAALVLGHHPHVPQGVERIGPSLLAYSLGNFYFSAYSSDYMRQHWPRTAQSFVLLAEVCKDGVRSFERVPFEIAPPPEERPAPLTGARGREMLAYLKELDGKAADDKLVAANWRAVALKHLELYLDRARKLAPEDLLEDILGRLLLVAENQGWVGEVFKLVRANWARQARRLDPYHRPHYALTHRRK